MIGWGANLLILTGFFLVGSRQHVRKAFTCQLIGNAAWCYIGIFRYDGKDQVSLITLSAVLCCLYVRNIYRWGKQV